jgi:hypothetical protein
MYVCVYLLALGPVLGREGSRGFSNCKNSKKEVEYIRIEKYRSENYVKLERIDRIKCMEVKWI